MSEPGTWLVASLLLAGGVSGAGLRRAEPAVEVRVGAVESACLEDPGGHGTLNVHLRLDVRVSNPSAEPLILSRRLAAASWYRLADSPEAGAGGHYREMSGDELWTEAEAHSFGTAPDRQRFVVLAPGASYDTTVDTGFLDSRSEPTERYAFQTALRTWPFLPMSSDAVAGMVRRWAGAGRLATTDVVTPFLSVAVPSELPACAR